MGFIYRSTDAGRHWAEVTPACTLPDAWGDGKVAADLAFEHGVADWNVNKQHYWIAWYQQAGAYRGYLFHTADDGRCWSAYALGGTAGAVSTWHYPVANVAAWGTITEQFGVNGHSEEMIPVTVENMLGPPDGNTGGGRFEYTLYWAPGPNCNPWGGHMYFLLDMGFWVQVNAVTRFNDPDLGLVNALLRTGVLTDTGPSAPALSDFWTFKCNPGVAPDIFFKNTPPAWVNNTKYGDTNSSDFFRYILLDEYVYMGGGTSGASVSEWVIDYIGFYAHDTADEVRPISLALDFETSRWLYMTTWEGEALRLRVYDLVNVGMVAPIRTVHLGNCTRAEYDARTYVAYVKASADASMANYSQRILVYGRWDDGTVRHVMRSDDAAVTPLVDIGDSGVWGARWAGAAVWENWNTIRMCMNGATDYLTGTTNGGTNWNAPTANALPFEVEKAMTMHQGGNRTIVIGQRDGNGSQKQASPYTGAWVDISPGGAGTSVGAMHWVYGEVP